MPKYFTGIYNVSSKKLQTQKHLIICSFRTPKVPATYLQPHTSHRNHNSSTHTVASYRARGTDASTVLCAQLSRHSPSPKSPKGVDASCGSAISSKCKLDHSVTVRAPVLDWPQLAEVVSGQARVDGPDFSHDAWSDVQQLRRLDPLLALLPALPR